MVLLLMTICWYIVESIIIPSGFVKWFYLRFYIHPFFLFFCQIFLWLHLLWTYLLRLLSTLHRLASAFFSFIFSSSFRLFITKPPNTATTTTSAHATAAQTVKKPNIAINQTISQHKSYVLINRLSYLLTASTIEFKMISVVESDHLLEENHDDHVHEAKTDYDEEEEELVNNEAIRLIIMPPDHLPSSFSSSTLTISNSSLRISIAAEDLGDDIAVVDNGGRLSMEEDSDPFYQKYSDRMRWFDMLNQDRTLGIGEIVEKELDISQNPNMFSSSSWEKMTASLLLRSLESDLELVYVAHSCLSWDALYHQFKKVEDVHAQNINLKYNYNYNIPKVADRFQKFQILLERFTEENNIDSKKKKKKKMRHFNYVHSRLTSFNTLLQVPPLSEEILLLESMAEGEGAIEVVKSIEKCIEAFWQYIRTTNKKAKRFSWMASSSPVEDPRDIKLFIQLTKTLKKKEMWVKELQGKRRCCFRKLAVRPVIEEESQKKEMMFTMIEMKLVAMVLNMSVVSSSHLKWCQDKLSSIHFTHGRRIITTRASPSSLTTAAPNSLFPISEK